jgi:uncharacterized repeat protein (TIGR01451 family)
MSQSQGEQYRCPGDILTYTICYDNLNNNNLLPGCRIVDVIPKNTTFVSASDGGIYEEPFFQPQVRWELGDVPPNAPQKCMTLKVRADKPLGIDVKKITNEANFWSSESWLAEATTETSRGYDCKESRSVAEWLWLLMGPEEK